MAPRGSAFQQQEDKYEHPGVRGSSTFSFEPPARLPASSLTPPSAFTPGCSRNKESSIPRDSPKDTSDQAYPAYVHSSPLVAPGAEWSLLDGHSGPCVRMRGPP